VLPLLPSSDQHKLRCAAPPAPPLPNAGAPLQQHLKPSDADDMLAWCKAEAHRPALDDCVGILMGRFVWAYSWVGEEDRALCVAWPWESEGEER